MRCVNTFTALAKQMARELILKHVDDNVVDQVKSAAVSSSRTGPPRHFKSQPMNAPPQSEVISIQTYLGFFTEYVFFAAQEIGFIVALGYYSSRYSSIHYPHKSWFWYEDRHHYSTAWCNKTCRRCHCWTVWIVRLQPLHKMEWHGYLCCQIFRLEDPVHHQQCQDRAYTSTDIWSNGTFRWKFDVEKWKCLRRFLNELR